MQMILGSDFAGELALTVLGGVITGLVLEMFRSRARDGRTPSDRAPRRGDGFFAGLLRLMLAVLGGVLIAVFVGRLLFQAGVLERGLPARISLLVGGTALIWILLLALRRRR